MLFSARQIITDSSTQYVFHLMQYDIDKMEAAEMLVE